LVAQDALLDEIFSPTYSHRRMFHGCEYQCLI
jgi:hypothetical protein